MSEPKVTVLMPAYNAGQYIREAISSVLEQSFTDFELLIINDGSIDDTLQVINGFDDERIVVINQENKGIATALNNGLQLARAPYIARFDADDICYPQRLQLQYDFMSTHPGYSIIGSSVDYTDVDGKYLFTHLPEALSYDEITKLDYKICPFIHSSVFYKKDVILAHGGYNAYAYTYEDHFLWAHTLKNTKACNLPVPLIKVRFNPESITIDEKWRTAQFRQIKYNTLKDLKITRADFDALTHIAQKQYSAGIKHSAYYGMLGKKYLWNNHQPEKAREYLLKALAISPFHFKNYLLLALSFVPQKILVNFYRSVKPNYKAHEPEAATEPIITRKEELTYGS